MFILQAMYCAAETTNASQLTDTAALLSLKCIMLLYEISYHNFLYILILD